MNDSSEIKEIDRSTARLKADLIAQIYDYIGMDAINVGELDLVLGFDYLKRLAEKYDLPLVSANLVDETDSLVFKPYVIKEINGRKVGIFGLMGDSFEMVSELEAVTGGKLSVKDPLQCAETVVEILKGKVDYIVALTHQPIGQNWIVARRVKGIDLIVGGHGQSKTERPYTVGDTFIVQSGEKSHYQGMFELTSGSGEAKIVKNSLVKLGSDIADDIRVKEMISRYKKKLISMNTSAQKEMKM